MAWTTDESSAVPRALAAGQRLPIGDRLPGMPDRPGRSLSGRRTARRHRLRVLAVLRRHRGEANSTPRYCRPEDTRIHLSPRVPRGSFVLDSDDQRHEMVEGTGSDVSTRRRQWDGLALWRVEGDQSQRHGANDQRVRIRQSDLDVRNGCSYSPPTFRASVSRTPAYSQGGLGGFPRIFVDFFRIIAKTHALRMCDDLAFRTIQTEKRRPHRTGAPGGATPFTAPPRWSRAGRLEYRGCNPLQINMMRIVDHRCEKLSHLRTGMLPI